MVIWLSREVNRLLPDRESVHVGLPDERGISVIGPAVTVAWWRREARCRARESLSHGRYCQSVNQSRNRQNGDQNAEPGAWHDRPAIRTRG